MVEHRTDLSLVVIYKQVWIKDFYYSNLWKKRSAGPWLRYALSKYSRFSGQEQATTNFSTLGQGQKVNPGAWIPEVKYVLEKLKY